MQQGLGVLQIQSQNLIITPQLQQSLRVLQCSSVDLEDIVEKELLENPVLERKEDLDTEGQDTPRLSERQASSAGPAEDLDMSRFEKLAVSRNNERNSNDKLIERTVRQETCLADFLLTQLGQMELSKSQLKIANYIIGNLDQAGYLAMACREISDALKCSLNDVQSALEVVQSLEPTGIGARDLRECLLLQLNALGKQDSLEGRIVERHLDLVKDSLLSQIASIENVSLYEVQQALGAIRRLTPDPGSVLSNESTAHVIPDVIVRKCGVEYLALVNGDMLPKLQVNPEYEELYKTKKTLDHDCKTYLTTKMRGASWLIRCIAQREQTLRKVSASIVRHQQRFFDEGLTGLKPLSLKDIAREISVHESTVSRAVANKFMDTPRGIFEFKYFLVAGVHNVEGGVSTHSIKERIRAFIKNEDPNSPISDQKVAELLRREQVSIARRTVTKYREAMGLAAAISRKHALVENTGVSSLS